ncbi:MAG TPA: MAPEG family protein [Rhizomicrobium sp.]|nr:MAPEG family protein [Rhizomicrobium sp.]
MSLSLWMLLAFACWTLLVLLVGVGMRRWLLIFQGRAALTSFPGDTPHGSAAYRRAMRAHANCVENLPVFGAIVLVGAFSQRITPMMDMLAVAFMAARIIQTSIHMALPESNTTIAVRFSFFLIQIVAMIAMAVQIAI